MAYNVSSIRLVHEILTDDKSRWSWEGGQNSKTDIVLDRNMKSLTVEPIRRQVVFERSSFAGFETAFTDLVHEIQLVVELYRLEFGRRCQLRYVHFVIRRRIE